MKVGDLVKWIGVAYPAGPGERIAIVLGKWANPHPDDTTHYWRVFIHGEAVLMGEEYLKVIHESR